MGKTGQNMGYLSGMNYLDAFWKVLTWIGNTFGLIWMIWTALIKESGAALKFIPNEAIKS